MGVFVHSLSSKMSTRIFYLIFTVFATDQAVFPPYFATVFTRIPRYSSPTVLHPKTTIDTVTPLLIYGCVHVRAVYMCICVYVAYHIHIACVYTIYTLYVCYICVIYVYTCVRECIITITVKRAKSGAITGVVPEVVFPGSNGGSLAVVQVTACGIAHA